ncbi:MAG: hypothetical protein M3426_04615 [Actinomycetota bacterium]|nr:hypothetical protein [Actinomycetota bacterium]
MAERSVDQTHRPSTRAITVDEELARRMALYLFADQEPIIAALEGEPVKEALAMIEWCVRHEGDPGFDAAKALPAWAKRRGRGRWSDRPTQAARIVWGEVPARGGGCAGCGETRREVHEVTEDHESLTFHGGDLICASCAGAHGVTL